MILTCETPAYKQGRCGSVSFKGKVCQPYIQFPYYVVCVACVFDRHQFGNTTLFKKSFDLILRLVFSEKQLPSTDLKNQTKSYYVKEDNYMQSASMCWSTIDPLIKNLVGAYLQCQRLENNSTATVELLTLDECWASVTKPTMCVANNFILTNTKKNITLQSGKMFRKLLLVNPMFPYTHLVKAVLSKCSVFVLEMSLLFNFRRKYLFDRYIL